MDGRVPLKNRVKSSLLQLIHTLEQETTQVLCALMSSYATPVLDQLWRMAAEEMPILHGRRDVFDEIVTRRFEDISCELLHGRVTRWKEGTDQLLSMINPSKPAQDILTFAKVLLQFQLDSADETQLAGGPGNAFRNVLFPASGKCTSAMSESGAPIQPESNETVLDPVLAPKSWSQ